MGFLLALFLFRQRSNASLLTARLIGADEGAFPQVNCQRLKGGEQASPTFSTRTEKNYFRDELN